MKLDFWKGIKGMDNLQEYVKELDPFKLDNRYVVGLEYDLWKLSSVLTDEIEKELSTQGFGLKRSAPNSIWVAEPDPFALELNTNIDGMAGGDTRRVYYYSSRIDDEKFEQIDTKYVERRFRKTEMIPVLREIPHVYVGGEVKYELLGGNEPTKLIEVFDKLKYASRVTPTPDELVEALERARQAAKRRHSSSDDMHVHAGDDPSPSDFTSLL